MDGQNDWPALPLDEWEPTYLTLHRWLQMAGKLALALAPPTNHWWHAAMRVDGRGLSTAALPAGGGRSLTLTFDFRESVLRFDCSDGQRLGMDLTPRTVRAFYDEFRQTLGRLDVTATIWPVPVEVPDVTPFDEDELHRDYDPDAAGRLYRILLGFDRLFRVFRGRFVGKATPPLFWWGSFDLAVNRFNGEEAPARPGTDPVTAEAYSHKVISAGFWPGGTSATGVRHDRPTLYAYAAPTPDGFSGATVRPDAARWHEAMGEFVLDYDALRRSADPDAAALDFLQSTYAAAADLAGWDRRPTRAPRVARFASRLVRRPKQATDCMAEGRQQVGQD